VAFRIPFNPSTWGQAERAAAKAVVDSGQLVMGERCIEFEAAFAAYIGCDHAIMVNSGSSANLLAMSALAHSSLQEGGSWHPIAPGAEVIVPALAWPTTVWPIVQVGAKPVFVDCESGTLQMTAGLVEEAITPQTVGIVVVHALGSATNVGEIINIAQRHGVWLFEDSCQALGVVWNGKNVGSFGAMGSFSFSSSQITTIEGGMVVTNDEPLANLLKALRTNGWIRPTRSSHEAATRHSGIERQSLFVSAGFNFRPTEINAATGLEQLKRLDRLNDARRTVARHFDSELETLTHAGCLNLVRHDGRSVPAPLGYPVLCSSRDARDSLRDHLETASIETRPWLGGSIVRHPAFKAVEYRVNGELRCADHVTDCCLCWGTHPDMTSNDVRYVVEAVRRYFQSNTP